jgi:hypothetical protein
MRYAIPILVLIPSLVFAQSPDEIKSTLQFIDTLRDPVTGAYAVTAPKAGESLVPSLRACNGAIRAIANLGGTVSGREKLTKFVMGCYDEKTGTFAEPGSKPDVAMTSIGVLTAVELGIPKEKYKKAMTYLMENAKEFEQVRIGAAAVEAFGVEESGLELKPWFQLAESALAKAPANAKNGGARDVASAASLLARLGNAPTGDEKNRAVQMLQDGQLPDGGWGKLNAKQADSETTYRAMRCLKLLGEKPANFSSLQKYLESCRRSDGGYGIDATAPSSMSGVYYFAIVRKWHTDMQGR